MHLCFKRFSVWCIYWRLHRQNLIPTHAHPKVDLLLSSRDGSVCTQEPLPGLPTVTQTKQTCQAPPSRPSGFKSGPDWRLVCMFAWPRLSPPPLGAPGQFAASKENQPDNEWNQQQFHVMSCESKQDWLVEKRCIRVARLGCFPWGQSDESPY